MTLLPREVRNTGTRCWKTGQRGHEENIPGRGTALVCRRVGVCRGPWERAVFLRGLPSVQRGHPRVGP